MLIVPSVEIVKPRIIEAAEIDSRGMLRPLLLFRGGLTEGRARSMWNTVTSMMDAGVPSVTEAVKTARTEDYRHMCGLHANPQNMAFNGILSRMIVSRPVCDLIPGLWEYARHLANSSGAFPYRLDPISEYTLWKTRRAWRIMPDEMRPRHPRKERCSPKHAALPEMYPYISGPTTSEHDLLLAVDACVPKGLPNDVRCDVCQDMLVAILSGETTVDNIRGETGKFLKQFWKAFPLKYGHVSLDGVVPGTDNMRLGELLVAKTGRLA